MMILTKRFCDPPNLSPIGFWRARSGFLRCKSIVFRGAKVWFLRCEKWVFVVRKYGFYDATNQRKGRKVEVGANRLIMRKKRNGLHRSTLFKKGRNMQI